MNDESTLGLLATHVLISSLLSTKRTRPWGVLLVVCSLLLVSRIRPFPWCLPLNGGGDPAHWTTKQEPTLLESGLASRIRPFPRQWRVMGCSAWCLPLNGGGDPAHCCLDGPSSLWKTTVSERTCCASPPSLDRPSSRSCQNSRTKISARSSGDEMICHHQRSARPMAGPSSRR